MSLNEMDVNLDFISAMEKISQAPATIWSNEELYKLIKLIREYGTNYKMISEKIGNRNIESCRKRSYKILRMMELGKMPLDQKFKFRMTCELAKRQYFRGKKLARGTVIVVWSP